jgi:hypothetical protein
VKHTADHCSQAESILYILVIKKKTSRNRALNALEIAERENPDNVNIKIPRHRLGQVDDDDEEEPRTRAGAEEGSSKRRKINTTVRPTSSSLNLNQCCIDAVLKPC